MVDRVHAQHVCTHVHAELSLKVALYMSSSSVGLEFVTFGAQRYTHRGQLAACCDRANRCLNWHVAAWGAVRHMLGDRILNCTPLTSTCNHSSAFSQLQDSLAGTMSLKLWGCGVRNLKCQLVAAFADVDLELPPFSTGITNRTPWYLAMNPRGKVC